VDLIVAGDSHVGRAVGDVGGDVRRPDEQQGDLGVDRLGVEPAVRAVGDGQAGPL